MIAHNVLNLFLNWFSSDTTEAHESKCRNTQYILRQTDETKQKTKCKKAYVGCQLSPLHHIFMNDDDLFNAHVLPSLVQSVDGQVSLCAKEYNFYIINSAKNVIFIWVWACNNCFLPMYWQSRRCHRQTISLLFVLLPHV